MKKVFVTGSAGLVGSRFVELYKYKYKLLTPEIDELDLTNKSAVKLFIQNKKPDIIVHFAAYTNVSEAEKQRGDKVRPCHAINVGATRNLVKSINTSQTHFIHISTDMVFSGSKNDPGPYDESRKPEDDFNKLTWYGFTKAEAERIVLEKLKGKATILRLTYPVRAEFEDKLDYIKNVLELYDGGKLYPMFTDQQISISFVDEICTALDKIVEGKHFGTFHASTPNTTTPYQLVSYLLKRARNVEDILEATSMDKFLASFENPARYPKHGGLKVEQTEKTLAMKFSTWQEVVDELVQQGLGINK